MPTTAQDPSSHRHAPHRHAPAPHEIEALRTALRAERRFRLEQLAAPATGPGDAALAEVRAAVLEGARRALADIDDALEAMRQGRYTRCRDCAGPIPWEVLRVIPRTRRCTACHAAAEAR